MRRASGATLATQRRRPEGLANCGKWPRGKWRQDCSVVHDEVRRAAPTAGRGARLLAQHLGNRPGGTCPFEATVRFGGSTTTR